MAKTITKITDTNVAVIETFERKNVFSKKELEERLLHQKKDVKETEELLAIFTA